MQRQGTMARTWEYQEDCEYWVDWTASGQQPPVTPGYPSKPDFRLHDFFRFG